jgi:alanine racemase
VAHIPLRLKIDGSALAANWRWLAAKGGDAACGAAVKANGYGLGAREAVRHLAEAGCRDFFVATWAEAAALLPWPDHLGLSVLHGIGRDDLADARTLPARPVLNTMAQVGRWQEGGAGRPCDVMVDTGMNRLGLTPEEARQAVSEGLQIDTLMSHLACADEPEHPLNELQLHRFQQVRRELPAKRYSMANSAGICLGGDYSFDLTRPGLALYGGVPVPGDDEQERAITQVAWLEAQLVQIRQVPAGGSIGYGATYTATSDRSVGILNIGYADGYLHLLGPHGRASRGEQGFAMLGRVSMDLLAVDLTDAQGLEEGDWLEIDYRLSDLAGRSGLSQYELLTNLGARFERTWA